MRPTPLLALSALALIACPGGEPVPIITDDTEAPVETADPDTGPDTPVEQEVPITDEWDPDDFYSIIDVGPGQDVASPCEVDWEDLQGGTMVRIHHQDEPYRCRFAIVTDAYENHPVVVMGVPDDEGNLPVISGADAVLAHDEPLYGQDTWVVQVGGADAKSIGAWIWLQDLVITGAHPDNSFIDAEGGAVPYAPNGAGLRIARAHNVHLIGVELQGNHTGLYVTEYAEDILVAASWLHDNGSATVGATQNSYSEAVGVTFEYNRFGDSISGAAGANMVDRSAGLTLRYNWFEGEVEHLVLQGSLVEDIQQHDDYDRTAVYGNVFVAPSDDGIGRLISYGAEGDPGSGQRPGTLQLFHNTFVSERSGNTYLLRLDGEEVAVDVRNNLIYAPGAEHTVTVLSGSGALTMRDNWVSESYQAVTSAHTGTVTEEGTTTGDDPGFDDFANGDLHPSADSPCRDLAGELADEVSDTELEYQYLVHQRRAAREGRADVGAYEGLGE